MNQQDTSKCENFREIMHFVDFGDKSEQAVELDAHLAACSSCYKEWEALQAVLKGLSSVTIPAMRPEFADQAFTLVRQSRSQNARKKVKTFRPALGLAASVLLAAVFVYLNNPTTPAGLEQELVDATAPVFFEEPFSSKTESSEPGSQIESLTPSYNLRLAFNSPGSAEGVGIKLVLPEGIGLAGREDNELNWKINLVKGKNELQLPLVKLANGSLSKIDQIVTAQLSHGDQVKAFRVRLVQDGQVG
jgi:hypothetical protein